MTDQEARRLREIEAREFNRGYVIACCNLSNLHHEESMAYDVLNELGVTRAEVKQMDLAEYDRSALRKIEKARNGSPYADGRKRRRSLSPMETKHD